METATETQPQKELISNDVAICVSGLSKRYLIGGEKKGTLTETLAGMIGAKNNRKEEFWALKDVHFEVKKGEVIGIIGKNGAGKSTLLKILSRITQPTSGKIEINGRVASLLEVGTGFHPELTGRENIYLNGTILGMSRQEVKDKFEEIVQFSGVQKFIDTPVKHYSSGMYVRLAFAVAAHLEPEILIIDEVLAVGDVEFQKKCLGKMKEVAQQGRTVLFVSHNMAAVKQLCNSGIFVCQGEILKTGDVSDVISFYLSSITNSQKDLREISKRKGNSKLKFSEINFLDYAGNKVDAVLSGSEIHVELLFDNFLSAKNENLVFRIIIKNDFDEVIFICNNKFIGHKIDISPDENKVVFKILKLPLFPGKYSLSVACGYPGEIFDQIDTALKFDVLDGDFYNQRNSQKQQAKSIIYVDFDVAK